MNWTPEAEAMLRKMWDTDMSASEIMILIEGSTRSGVIGKAHRMGLPQRRGRDLLPAERPVFQPNDNACPCCGAPVKATVPIEGLEFIPFPKMPRRIVDALLKHYPKGVSANALADAVYWDDPNGGPENAVNSIAVTVHRIRPQLAKVGWSIGTKGARGGGIRLWPLEQAI